MSMRPHKSPYAAPTPKSAEIKLAQIKPAEITIARGKGFGGEADERGVNGRGRRRSIPGASNISGRRSDAAFMDSNLTSQPIRASLRGILRQRSFAHRSG
jgi:hypothetical protein